MFLSHTQDEQTIGLDACINQLLGCGFCSFAAQSDAIFRVTCHVSMPYNDGFGFGFFLKHMEVLCDFVCEFLANVVFVEPEINHVLWAGKRYQVFFLK